MKRGINMIREKDSQKIGILNTSILTNFGTFEYKKITLEKAKSLIAGKEILSAIGHKSTSDILTDLLEMPIPLNRIQFAQEVGQKAIVFKLNGRPEEGVILSRDEIEKIGYEFGLLVRRK